MKGDLGKSFKKLMDYTFIKYRGCLIERLPDGFRWSGSSYTCEEDVKKAIDEAYNRFGDCFSD